MSKKLPADEAFRQIMNELPLPDEDESWQKMKQLLDEKEKRRVFAFLRNDKILSGAILLLLLCFWLVISPEKMNRQASVAAAKYKASEKQNSQQKKTKEWLTDNDFPKNKTSVQQVISAGISSSVQRQNNKGVDLSQRKILFSKNKQPNDELRKQYGLKKDKLSTAQSGKNSSAKAADVRKNVPDRQFNNNSTVLQDLRKKQQSKIIGSDSVETPTAIDKDSNFSALVKTNSSNKTLAAKDSLQHQTNNTETVETFKKSLIVKRHNSYFADAGIGVNQQIPTGGQKFVSYNYRGNKTMLTDYIPSVYVKLEKEKQWFLQAEFNYASPRLIKEITYRQTTKADYTHGSITVSANRLQKTFYNEVPVSFNLYLRSSWSVGAGAMYSWLRGAVADKETVVNDEQSGQQVTATQVMPIKGFTDSFLYKTQTSLLLQTNYEKNRWLFGLRYIKDIQPFLTYISPGGIKIDKRNSSLELLIRYRLFRSGKFRLMNKK